MARGLRRPGWSCSTLAAHWGGSSSPAASRWELVWSFYQSLCWCKHRRSWYFAGGNRKKSRTGLTGGLDGGWNAVATPVVVLVVAGWVEVAHAATGLTKSSTRFIFFGNFPRAVALLVVPLAGGDFHGSPVITVMFAAWAAAELIRAPFYVANELGVLPGWLKLLRYTAFVVLSPARPHGIVCSLAVQLRCLIGAGAVVLQAALAAELYIFYAAALVEETRLDRFMAEQALLPANTPGLEHLQLRYILCAPHILALPHDI
jgi:hypothetical protein